LIIDTSALIAVLRGEAGADRISRSLTDERGFLPTPVLVEFHRVAALTGNAINLMARDFLNDLIAHGHSVEPLDAASAFLAIEANATYGSGNGRGGALNMLDLMVYGLAKARNANILCTGKDFASTDAKIHPASRIG